MVKMKGAGPRPSPNPDDELQVEATEAAAMAMTPLLEQYGLRRQIHTLTRDELAWLAVAAITAWVIRRSDQYKRTGDEAIGKELFA